MHPENTRAPLPELARLRQREIDVLFLFRFAWHRNHITSPVLSLLMHVLRAESTGR